MSDIFNIDIEFYDNAYDIQKYDDFNLILNYNNIKTKYVDKYGVDPYFYKSSYPDLKNLTNNELFEHYKTRGKKEHRVPYDRYLEMFNNSFDIEYFKNKNPDFKFNTDTKDLENDSLYLHDKNITLTFDEYLKLVVCYFYGYGKYYHQLPNKNCFDELYPDFDLIYFKNKYNLNDLCDDQTLSYYHEHKYDNLFYSNKCRQYCVDHKLTICLFIVATGNYNTYFDGLLTSIDEFFFTDHNIIVTIYSDDTENCSTMKEKYNNKIKIIHKYIPCRGFPADTLYRFHYFTQLNNDDMKSIEYLSVNDIDYMFYIDVDERFARTINIEILPDYIDPSKTLLGVHHPGMHSILRPHIFCDERMLCNFESNEKSTACIDTDINKYICLYNYVCGGFHGGKTKDYLILANHIAKNINTDDDNEMIAVHHDESHFNKYFNENYNKFKILDTTYCCPGYNKELMIEKMQPKVYTDPYIVGEVKDHFKFRIPQKMIYIKLMGGLGDMLFQLATGFGLHKRHNRLLSISLNHSEKSKGRTSYRKTVFSKFNRTDLDSEGSDSFKDITTIKEKYYGFNSKIRNLKNKKNTIIKLIGYFQSWRYFNKCYSEFIKTLNFDSYENDLHELYNRIKKQSNSLDIVAVLIKKNDPDNIYAPVTQNYYEKAFQALGDDKYYIIISDDNNIMRTPVFINLKNKQHIDNNINEVIIMLLIAQCKYHIMTNSTISFWSRMIGEYKYGITADIITPNIWFGKNGPNMIKQDFYIPNWNVKYINNK